MKKRISFAAIIVIALVLTVTTYAFAATNIVPETSAGDGSKVISGYTVTGVTYTLDASDPTKISGVSFTLTPTSANGSNATSASVSFYDGGAWYDCKVTGTAAACPQTAGTMSEDVTTAVLLDIVAAQ